MGGSTDIDSEVHELAKVMWSSCIGRHRDVVAGATLNLLVNIALKSTDGDKAKAEIMLRLLLEEAIEQLHQSDPRPP